MHTVAGVTKSAHSHQSLCASARVRERTKHDEKDAEWVTGCPIVDTAHAITRCGSKDLVVIADLLVEVLK